MGAEQSSGRGAGAGTGGRDEAPRKTCYYELLSVERSATDEEIKKAYRRKALELHPDRNIDDTANATRRFAEVQTAYEILSDPQERAWYDSHREAILRGDSGGEDEDGGGGGGGDGAYFYEDNLRLTTADALYALMGRFNASVPMDDGPAGFFGLVAATFAQLAREEAAAARYEDGSSGEAAAAPAYAPFGRAGDDYETVARAFYRDWAGFATRKSVRWKDRYRLAEAPDRAVRRLMDKENRKAREVAAREFNDAVRALVAFVRKRDPRYVAAHTPQAEAARQRSLRDSAAAQAARQRAANQERLERQRADAAAAEAAWSRLADDGGDGEDAGGGDGPEAAGADSSESEAPSLHEIECVVCGKTFKSERQYEAHEKSKKHIKAVQQLRRQMKKENRDLALEEEELAEQQAVADETQPATASEGGVEDPAPIRDGQDGRDNGGDSGGDDRNGDADADSEEDDEYAPREAVLERFGAGEDQGADDADDDDTDLAAAADALGLDDDDDSRKTTPPAKVGKAKAKREKKAARQAAEAAQGQACALCHETFASKTKLHKHLREAHPPEAPARPPRGKKKR